MVSGSHGAPQVILESVRHLAHADRLIIGRQGALYVDPVYVEMPAQPLQVSARFDWLSAGQQLLLQSFTFSHPGSAQLEGHGLFNLAADAPIRELQLEVRLGQDNQLSR